MCTHIVYKYTPLSDSRYEHDCPLGGAVRGWVYGYEMGFRSMDSGTMYARVRVDDRGRITLPKEFREALNIKEGDELLLSLHGNRIIVVKCEDPSRVLEEVLGDLTFKRSLRRIAEEEALRSLHEQS